MPSVAPIPPPRVPMPPLRPPPQPPRPAPEAPVTAAAPVAPAYPPELRSQHARVLCALIGGPRTVDEVGEASGLTPGSADTYLREARRMGLCSRTDNRWDLTAEGNRMVALDRTAELEAQHKAAQAKRAKPKAPTKPRAPRKAAAPKPAAPAVEVTPPTAASRGLMLEARIVALVLEVGDVQLEVRDPEALRRWLA